MDPAGHRLTTQFAAGLYTRHASTRLSRRTLGQLVKANVGTDRLQDLEFVSVHFGRDDPHHPRWGEFPDHPHYLERAKSLTTFDHFIDIQKGPGRFDDYDGYSYHRGSAATGEYQPAAELTGGWAHVFAELVGFTVDAGLSFLLRGEYVHVPGHRWYRGCSPAAEHYSFPQDRGRYRSRRAELAARFPLAAGGGGRGQGVPYSVFLPVDNLARYWYGRFEQSGRITDLGPVLHAVQDASVPHHAAGCSGNWHVEYEAALGRLAARAVQDRKLARRAAALVRAWDRPDPRPPRRSLQRRDRLRPPAVNWSVSHLVTWMALQAYQEYDRTYRHFRNGYRVNTVSMKRLWVRAAALSALLLIKSQPAQRPQSFGRE